MTKSKIENFQSSQNLKWHDKLWNSILDWSANISLEFRDVAYLLCLNVDWSPGFHWLVLSQAAWTVSVAVILLRPFPQYQVYWNNNQTSWWAKSSPNITSPTCANKKKLALVNITKMVVHPLAPSKSKPQNWPSTQNMLPTTILNSN